LTLSIGCRRRCRSSRAPPIVGHGSASELAPSVARRRTSNSAAHPSWHRRRNRVLHSNSALPIASAIFFARSHCPLVGLTCRMERCSEHADETAPTNAKAQKRNGRSIRKVIAAFSPNTLPGTSFTEDQTRQNPQCTERRGPPGPRRHAGVFLMVYRPSL
jgi:hypothetical protein